MKLFEAERTVSWANVPPDRNSEPVDRLIEGLRKAGVK